ncbi:hypothetical protein [Psychrobacter ciconiae]|uniref:hypothetical protein n=1 Tax=Psychrobacter ciconiae TaxID=1553449 RepID=UPI00191B8DC9|nr:hypothetical protein [Psychrobacter ciconiae]
MKETSGGEKALIVLYFSLPLSLITALIYDASNDRIGWLILDIVLFPIGILRGYFIWLAFLFS